MNPPSEQENFSQRLRQALLNANYSPDSPTQLAREFNRRFSTGHVTTHAVRKWLVGQSIPTQEKLRILAAWLDVTAEWLRYGGEQQRAQQPLTSDKSAALPDQAGSANAALIADYSRLDKQYQLIAREIIRMLVRINLSKN